jgi:GcrA cell cycle regulator
MRACPDATKTGGSDMALSAAATEFARALDAFDLSQSHAGQLFQVSPRHIRRWRSGSRRLPHAVGILCNLLSMKMVTLEQVELAAAAWTHGRAQGESPAPRRAKPEPEQSALPRAKVTAFADLSPAAAAILALGFGACRWPLGGDPQDRNFRFCCQPTATPPYCAHHRVVAYLAPRTSRGHGFRVRLVAHGRQPTPASGRSSILRAFSATSASQAPKVLVDRAGDLPGNAPPPT